LGTLEEATAFFPFWIEWTFSRRSQRMLSPDHGLRADQIPASEEMAFPAVELGGATGSPFHLKMIAVASLHPHALETFKPHPRLAARLKKSFLGRKKFGEFLEGETFEGPAFRRVKKAFSDIIPVAGKELLHAVAGHQIHTHPAQRGLLLLYEQH